MAKRRESWHLNDTKQFNVKETVTKWASQIGEPVIKINDQKEGYLRNLIVKQVATNEKLCSLLFSGTTIQATSLAVNEQRVTSSLPSSLNPELGVDILERVNQLLEREKRLEQKNLEKTVYVHHVTFDELLEQANKRELERREQEDKLDQEKRTQFQKTTTGIAPSYNDVHTKPRSEEDRFRSIKM